MKAFCSDEIEDQVGKKAPSLSVQPHLLEDMAQVMMHQGELDGKGAAWVLSKGSRSS